MWHLPDANYNHRITDLRKQVKSLWSQPYEWMQAVFTQWLGIQSPHVWQIENSLCLCQGLDVFITTKTGSGKLALALAPVIACCLRNEPHVAIVVYPMEALISDQVSKSSAVNCALTYRHAYSQEGKAQSGGVRFIAISSNILSHATIKGHNIWKEVENGMWDVVRMGPEMIQSAPVAWLLQSKRFLQRLGSMFIDEVHLVDEWGHTFRKDFLQLTELCSCVKSCVTFLGMSASLHDDN